MRQKISLLTLVAAVAIWTFQPTTALAGEPQSAHDKVEKQAFNPGVHTATAGHLKAGTVGQRVESNSADVTDPCVVDARGAVKGKSLKKCYKKKMFKKTHKGVKHHNPHAIAANTQNPCLRIRGHGQDSITQCEKLMKARKVSEEKVLTLCDELEKNSKCQAGEADFNTHRCKRLRLQCERDQHMYDMTTKAETHEEAKARKVAAAERK